MYPLHYQFYFLPKSSLFSIVYSDIFFLIISFPFVHFLSVRAILTRFLFPLNLKIRNTLSPSHGQPAVVFVYSLNSFTVLFQLAFHKFSFASPVCQVTQKNSQQQKMQPGVSVHILKKGTFYPCRRANLAAETGPKNFLPGLLSPILPLSFKFCPWPLRGGYFSSPRFCFDSRSTAQLIAIVGSASAPASTDRTVSAASCRIGWPSVLFFIWLSRLLYAPHLICTINYATRGLHHVSHTLSTE